MPSSEISPGSIVVVRDEEWLVTQLHATDDGKLITVQGISDLVRGTTASFYESLDEIKVLDPSEARLAADDSPGYRDAKLWLESTVRKTPLPLGDSSLTVSLDALANPLEYQHAAVKKALNPDQLRPRILFADAVGLGKTLEIGMILSELIRRGRGERILIVSPRHVLEQMQNEMWCRFSIPFVRLDSVGVQRVKQKLPATRNPFTYFNRVIVSMDTLKQDKFAADLRKHKWDAVVIDESHNVTNSSTQNNRLARILAPNTDALILASATPHNGKRESFAELVRLLEPTAVTPSGEIIDSEIERFVIRRHRGSAEVASVVGGEWAQRKPPQHFQIDASEAENAVADELSSTWLYPVDRKSPYSGQTSKLFPWTLVKSFLSSPAALDETIKARIKTVGVPERLEQKAEIAALKKLEKMNEDTFAASSKYDSLVSYLRTIAISKKSAMRAVIFAERVPTLMWLSKRLKKDFGFKDDAVRVLHGGLSDVEQQEIVDSFKQANSVIRVLVTGDIASEGVNLHKQCHELIHYDIPWSLIRIEQRNGRIDRYGQHVSPQITTLLLRPRSEKFSGDLHVLTKLLEKEEEAHKALGDAASLMGQYSINEEERTIAKVLAGQESFDDVVLDADQVPDHGDPLAALFAKLDETNNGQDSAGASTPGTGLYEQPVDFLREALTASFLTPGEEPSRGGVSWREYPEENLVEFVPPADLRQRFEALPQSYLGDRDVLERLVLATDKKKGQSELEAALNDDSSSSWPEAHYLAPLHPVLDWAADRALNTLSRNQVYAVRSAVDDVTMLLSGILTNRRGQTVSALWLRADFLSLEPTMVTMSAEKSPNDLFASVGFNQKLVNPGAVSGIEDLQPLVSVAVDQAKGFAKQFMQSARIGVKEKIRKWSERTTKWQQEANQLAQRLDIRERTLEVREEAQLIEQMAPTSLLIRPLLLVVPEQWDSHLGESI